MYRQKNVQTDRQIKHRQMDRKIYRQMINGNTDR